MADTNIALIDGFCDAAWIEDGLAKLTLEAYRRDLTQLARHLEDTGRQLVHATEEDLRGAITTAH